MVEFTSDISWEIPQCLVLAIGQIEQLLPSKGIYRVNGNALDVQLLKQQMDKNEFKPLQRCQDINAIASTVKLYIRELPQVLLLPELAMKIASVINVTCASLRGANISFPCDIKAENFVSVKSWKFNGGRSLARPRKINLCTA